MKKQLSKLALGSLALIGSSSALAHTGEHATGLLSGLMHPFAGADHLLAMLLVGVCAATLYSGRKALALPGLFLAGMSVGVGLAVANIALPVLEPVIALSVLALGVVLMLAKQLPLNAIALLVAGFAMFHGNAHGLEMPQLQPLMYAAGFMAATVALHVAGLTLGHKLVAHPKVLRVVGIASSIVGTSLILGA